MYCVRVPTWQMRIGGETATAAESRQLYDGENNTRNTAVE